MSTLSDSLICQEIFRSYTMEIITKMISGEGLTLFPLFLRVLSVIDVSFFFMTTGGGQLFQITVPAQFVDKTYLELLRWLQARNILLVGLYRSAMLDEDLPYVIVNCPHDTELREKDRAFVLASTEPEEKLL